MKQAIASGHKMVLIRINSPGGSVYALNQMLGTLELAKQMGVICVTMCTGIAMSCGSIMLAMGTKGYRYCSRHARILLHEISGGMRGSQTAMENELSEYAYDNADLFKKIARNAGIESGYYLSFVKSLHKDLFIHPARAKYLRLVDHIDLPYVKRVVTVEYKLVSPCDDPTEDQLLQMIVSDEEMIQPLHLDVLSKIPAPKEISRDPFVCVPKSPQITNIPATISKETTFAQSKVSRLPEGLF
jgi:ATP-dependent protease ClpP protease subunit